MPLKMNSLESGLNFVINLSRKKKFNNLNIMKMFISFQVDQILYLISKNMPVLRINKVNKLLTFKSIFLMKCLLAQYSTLYFIFLNCTAWSLKWSVFHKGNWSIFPNLPNLKIFPSFIFEAYYHLYQFFYNCWSTLTSDSSCFLTSLS